MPRSKTLTPLFWSDKCIHNFSKVSSKNMFDWKWLWKIQAMLVTHQQFGFLECKIEIQIFFKLQIPEVLKTVSSFRELKNQ